MTATPNVLTAHEASFQQTVIERSREVPVLVDFWAPWCGPCRVLSPTLEAMAAEDNGAWLLVKVNTDENQGLARAYGVRGIPYCVLFKDGVVVDSFVGAQSKPMVRRFLDKWVSASADESFSAIEAQIEAGDVEGARRALDAILAQDADDERARLTYARLALANNLPDRALDHLAYLPAEGAHAREIAILTAKANFARSLPTPHSPLDELQAAVDAAPNDYEARYRLGSAAALLDERELAAEQFFHILEGDRDWKEGAARNALLDLFSLWGEEAPETASYRHRMGLLLFS